MQEVPQGGATRLDGLSEDLFYGLGQFGVAISGHPPSRPARGDAGPEEGLNCVDIANAHDNPLIHQEGLNTGGPLPAALKQVVTSEVLGEGFWTKVLKEFMSLPQGLPEQTAEAARIGKPNDLSRIQGNVHMVVSPKWVGRWHHPKATGHAQMQEGAPRS